MTEPHLEEIAWEDVDGLGVLRDEVIAARMNTTPMAVRLARKRLGINRRTGPTGWRRRVDIIARDPASASIADVVFLVECIREARRRAESTRKAAEPCRLRANLRAARCALWALHCEESSHDLEGLPARIYQETIDAFHQASGSWWLRRAIACGHDLGWAERNAAHDPAPAEFLAWAMQTGKIDEHELKARLRGDRGIE